MNKTIAFIGAGNMATAIVSGLIAENYPSEKMIVTARTAEKLKKLAMQYHVQTTLSNVDAVNKADVVVLAVKPAQMQSVMDEISHALKQKKPLIISVASGVTLKQYENWSDASLSIIRAMPNTPASVGLAVTAFIGNKPVEKNDRVLAEQIFSAVGKVFWLAEEDQMNTVIALSGSGPAYLFLWMEMMEESARAMGLPAEIAHAMTQQLFLGASTLAMKSEKSFPELRRQVTSPGGTTEQAIHVFEKNNMREILRAAMEAAAKHGREMAK